MTLQLQQLLHLNLFTAAALSEQAVCGQRCVTDGIVQNPVHCSDVGMAVLDDVCTRLIRNTEEDRADELTLLRLRLLRLG